MKRAAGLLALSLVVVSATAFVAAVGSSRAAELTPHEKKLAAQASTEGSLTMIDASISDLTTQDLERAFVKRYNLGTSFKLNNLRKGTGATVAQARQEILADKHTIDIVLVSAPAFFDAAAKRGALLKLESDYWKDSEELAKKADQYVNYPYVVIPNASSFQPVWNSSCPGMSGYSANSYADVVKPELNGKTIVSDITKSLTYTNMAISLQDNGVIDLKAFWQKLKATNPIIEFRTEPKMQMVVSCQRPLDMWNLTGRAYQTIVNAPQLAKILKFGVYKGGQVMLGNQAAVFKGAPHPAAAQLLLDYMMSKEGTDVIVGDEAVYSFRKDYKPPTKAAHYLFDVNTTRMLGLKDWISAQKKFKPVRDEWLSVFK